MQGEKADEAYAASSGLCHRWTCGRFAMEGRCQRGDENSAVGGEEPAWQRRVKGKHMSPIVDRKAVEKKLADRKEGERRSEGGRRSEGLWKRGGDDFNHASEPMQDGLQQPRCMHGGRAEVRRKGRKEYKRGGGCHSGG